MRIRARKSFRLVTRLVVAVVTFTVGISAVYFYAEAAAFLFQPTQSTSETTTLLSTQSAAPPSFQFAPAIASTGVSQAVTQEETGCQNCVKDEVCGLCEQLTGDYTNHLYSYMLTIPDELQALRTPAPAFDHGFIARLRADPDALLEVEATYNPDLWDTLNEAVNAHIAYLRGGAQDLEVLKRDSARLGKRAAIRYVVRYTSMATGETMIEDKTLALKKEETDDRLYWTVYAVSLKTPAARYDSNRSALEKLLKRWRELESHGC